MAVGFGERMADGKAGAVCGNLSREERESERARERESERAREREIERARERENERERLFARERASESE